MVAAEEDSINITRLCGLCDDVLDGGDKGKIPVLIHTLDIIAGTLTKDEELRATLGVDPTNIWPRFRRLWIFLVENAAVHEDDALVQNAVISMSRFTRNLVAGVAHNQCCSFECEPAVRQILRIYSSWSASQDPRSAAVLRMAVQTLSNMVTANESLLSVLWETYMNLPEEQDILVRVLNSSDPRAVLSLVVLLINCVHQNSVRQSLLARTRIGARVCVTLLDRMTNSYDAEEASDTGKTFDYGYRLFASLFDNGLAPDLYQNMIVAGEVVAPHQIVLLKLLDSHLQSSPNPDSFSGMSPMLAACFFELSLYSSNAIRAVIHPNPPDTPDRGLHGSPDHTLPKACEALLLVAQCISSIVLASETKLHESREDHPRLLFRDLMSSDGHVIAEHAVEVLRLLDIFLPKIYFGRPVAQPNSIQSQGCGGAATDPGGFSYLKRDLVRLLGILCHKDRATQDRIRRCGGIPVIMNMHVIDERNPYMQEHVIFTLHNLLEENADNQAVVESLRSAKA